MDDLMNNAATQITTQAPPIDRPVDGGMDKSGDAGQRADSSPEQAYMNARRRLADAQKKHAKAAGEYEAAHVELEKAKGDVVEADRHLAAAHAG